MSNNHSQRAMDVESDEIGVQSERAARPAGKEAKVIDIYDRFVEGLMGIPFEDAQKDLETLRRSPSFYEPVVERLKHIRDNEKADRDDRANARIYLDALGESEEDEETRKAERTERTVAVAEKFLKKTRGVELTPEEKAERRGEILQRLTNILDEKGSKIRNLGYLIDTKEDESRSKAANAAIQAIREKYAKMSDEEKAAAIKKIGQNEASIVIFASAIDQLDEEAAKLKNEFAELGGTKSEMEAVGVKEETSTKKAAGPGLFDRLKSAIGMR